MSVNTNKQKEGQQTGESNQGGQSETGSVQHNFKIKQEIVFYPWISDSNETSLL